MQTLLSISLLVSRKSETLEKCLDSLVPLLQSLPSELIIVYTGPSDEFPEIINKYANQILYFQWCDDFSKARNAGLSKASGEWFLFIDDDEWFEDCTEIIDFFKNKDHEQFASACYIARNYEDMDGCKYSDIAVARMAKRIDGIQFTGIVHEMFSPWNKPTKYFKCFVHHYGYAKGNPSRGSEGYIRNIPLLEKQIRMEPNIIRNYVQLAQEYRRIKRYKESEACIRRALEEGKPQLDNYFVQWSAVYLVSLLMSRGEISDAYKEGINFITSKSLSELYQMNLYLYMVPACLDLKEYPKGIEFAEKFIQLTKNMNENPYKWDEQQLLDMNQSNITKESHYVFFSAVKCACNLEDFQAAARFLAQIDWESDYKQSEKFHFFEDLKKAFPSKLMNWLSVFESAQSKNPYILLQRTLLFEITGDLTNAEEGYYQCQEVSDKNFSGPLISMAVRQGYTLPWFIETMDLDEWKQYAQDVADYIKSDETDILKKIESAFHLYPMHKMVLQQKLLAELLYDKRLGHDKVIQLLHEYCDVVLKLNHLIHKEELFQKEYLFCLPKECRIALDMVKIFQYLNGGEYKECIHQIREMSNKYPSLSYVFQILADYVNERLEQSFPRNNKKEFEKMGNRVKNIMKTLAEKEQFQEALKIAEELERLIPDDLEVVQYKKLLTEMIN